ncbi:MAG TPA: zinc-ribbon domain-containing protein [Alphaproteobacteria bacterium]|nr:zinc-ribbon domain-containing protein [Alphaproteobacteria bacterium]
MIVICPNCSKRYMLDDNLIPQEGRQVRCIACHHVWRQALDIEPAINAPSIRGIPDATFEIGLSSEKKSGWLGWVVFFALVLTFISALTLGRDFVAKLWPQTERFYSLIGLHINSPGAGLSIANASSLIHQDGPIDMIKIAGDVINTSDRVRPIPPLKIKLMGEASHPKCSDKPAEGCVLDYWEYRLSESFLLPGEQLHFETEPRPKVDGTQHVAVEF